MVGYLRRRFVSICISIFALCLIKMPFLLSGNIWILFQLYDDSISPFEQIALFVVAVALFAVIFLQLHVQIKSSQQEGAGKILCICGFLLVMYIFSIRAILL